MSGGNLSMSDDGKEPMSDGNLSISNGKEPMSDGNLSMSVGKE